MIENASLMVSFLYQFCKFNRICIVDKGAHVLIWSTEQRKQKISDVKAGIDEAESLVINLADTCREPLLWYFLLHIREMWSLVYLC